LNLFICMSHVLVCAFRSIRTVNPEGFGRSVRRIRAVVGAKRRRTAV
jgi:hypothetical protein